MMLKNKKVFIACAAGLGLLSLVIFDWKCNLKSGEKRLVEEFEDSAYYKIVEDKDMEGRQSKLEDYHITEANLSKDVQSQMQWDFRTQETVKELGVVELIGNNQGFRGGMKTAQKYQQRLERMDARISEYRLLLEADPNDPELIEQLNNLLQMRAMVSNLEDAVVDK